jgi:hypothetical protein
MPDHNLETRETAAETRERATMEEEAVEIVGTAKIELEDSPPSQELDLDITETIPRSLALLRQLATQRRQQVDLLGATTMMCSLWKPVS